MIVTLPSIAVISACGATQRPDPYPDAAQRAVLERYVADCQRARAVIESEPPRASADPEFARAVAMLPCPSGTDAGALIARAWQRGPADRTTTESLVQSSMRTGGQTVFRAVLQVARDSTHATPRRLAAFRVLASYVEAHAVFDLPADGRPSFGAVDHPSFNWHATYEAFAPDTVMAALQDLASVAMDPVVRHSAAFVRRALAPGHASAHARAAETARRTGVAARAAGCYVVRHGPPPVPAWPGDLASRTDTIELRDEPDRGTFGRARVLRARGWGMHGGWDERGPDSVAVRRRLPSRVAWIVFPVGGDRARVTVDDDAGAEASVRRVACPGRRR